MADKSEDPRSGSGTSADPNVAALALGAASRERADAYLGAHTRMLEEQTEVLRLQKEQMREESAIHRWMLRFEHASAGMKVAFEIAVAFIVVIAAVLVGGAVWSAMNDNGLVVEPFSVPSDYASRGLTGQVLASHLLDRLSELQVETKSLRRGATYTNNWGDDIKVEIPTTGISLTELQRFLNAWLGHETRISGEVYRTADGIAVASRVGTEMATIFEGREVDLDKLVTRAAEQVYKQTQPFRYAYYLASHGQGGEAEALLAQLATTGSTRDRAWAYALWAGRRVVDLDPQGAIDKATLAVAMDPELPVAHDELGVGEAESGHMEAALGEFRAYARLAAGSGRQYFEPEAPRWSLPMSRSPAEEHLGDYRAEADDQAEVLRLRGTAIDRLYLARALVRDHDVSAALRILHDQTPVSQIGKQVADNIQAFAMIESGSWPALLKLSQSADSLYRSPPRFVAFANFFPLGLAYGLARAGDIGEAESLISTTPPDCYGCVRERGDVAAVKGDRKAAEYWYADAIRQAPSIPFAYWRWGALLLQRGDYDGAIERFREANKKGPHFADPLEMWGEALMQKNRSDLALAKFEEANKYAPRWGRLHLKWGEALFYLGRKGEARARFTAAGGMDMSAADRARLAEAVRAPNSR
jgi:tetratricopeptide (TPR) repeat protein